MTKSNVHPWTPNTATISETQDSAINEIANARAQLAFIQEAVGIEPREYTPRAIEGLHVSLSDLAEKLERAESFIGRDKETRPA